MTGRPAPGGAFPVLVLGAGTIGSGWGAWFSHRGLPVCLLDPGREPAAMQDAVAAKLEQLRQSGIPGAETAGAIATAAAPRALPEDIGFVQESVTEIPGCQEGDFAGTGSVAPPWTVIASSTTSLKPSDIQAGCRHPERILVGHPFNPPHLLPLVEVVAGRQTDGAAVDWAMDFYRAVGKFPVRVRREVTGHVANRLTSALFREAVHLLAEGVATAAELDDVLTHGPGLRWALQGPWLTYHLGGGLDRGIFWMNGAVVPVPPVGAGVLGAVSGAETGGPPAPGLRFRVRDRESGRHSGRGDRAAGARPRRAAEVERRCRLQAAGGDRAAQAGGAVGARHGGQPDAGPEAVADQQAAQAGRALPQHAETARRDGPGRGLRGRAAQLARRQARARACSQRVP